MLDKLITNIKNSLPGAKKNEEEEDEILEETLDSDEEGDEISAEDEKKKKMSMMIRVVVILLLGYLAVDHFFLNPEQEQSIDQLAANAPVKRKRPKPIVKPADETTDAQVPSEAQPVQEEKKEEVAQTETPTTDPSYSPGTANSGTTASNESPVENINITEKAAEETSAPIAETPVTEEVVTTPMGENTLDNRLDQLIDNVEQKEKPSKAASLADKIVEEDVQTAPPAFDVLGRGLVYNCKDKFWACIDKPGYVTCNKNMKWNKSKGNPAECVIQNVYSSDEDCIKVQKYNVSSNQPTTFCQ